MDSQSSLASDIDFSLPIKSICNPAKPLSVSPSTSIRDAWAIFFKNTSRGLVIQNSDTGRVLGFLSLRDLMTYALRLYFLAATDEEIQSNSKLFLDTPVSKIAENRVLVSHHVCLPETAAISEALKALQDGHQLVILLNQDKQCTGFVSQSDLLQWIRKSYNLEDVFVEDVLSNIPNVLEEIGMVNGALPCHRAFATISTFPTGSLGILSDHNGKLCLSGMLSTSDILILGPPDQFSLSHFDDTVTVGKSRKWLHHRTFNAKPVRASQSSRLTDTVETMLKLKLHRMVVMADDPNDPTPYVGVVTMRSVLRQIQISVKNVKNTS